MLGLDVLVAGSVQQAHGWDWLRVRLGGPAAISWLETLSGEECYQASPDWNGFARYRLGGQQLLDQCDGPLAQRSLVL